jgi:hypothetical protein
MKRNLLLLYLLAATFFVHAQNVGLGTANPLARMHIFNGSSGGSAPLSNLLIESNGNNYMSFLAPNTASNVIWFSKPSALLGGGIFYNDPVAPDGFIFRANSAPRLIISNAGKVGIGLNNPGTKLHVFDGGGSGGTPFTFSRMCVESDGHTYINLLSPDANETAILFGKASDAVSGVIMYNNTATPNGFQFRTNSNQTKMVINNTGNVGIGTTTPQFPLDINGRMRLSGTSPNDPGIWLNNAAVDRAFIGLENNTYVGFYGNQGAGWKFGMNTQTGALKINGAEGAAGQVLQSGGSGAAPNWASSTNTLYSNTNVAMGTGTITVDEKAPAVLIPGLSNTFTVTTNAKALISFNVPVSTITCGFCNASIADVQLYLDGTYITTYSSTIQNAASLQVGGSYLFTLAPGTHTIQLKGYDFFGPSVNYGNTVMAYNLITQVIPQ